MTRGELIAALQESDAADDEEVLFALADADDPLNDGVLTVLIFSEEFAHDEDCTPFVRITNEPLLFHAREAHRL